MSWPHKSIVWCFRFLLVFVPLIFLPNTSELFEFNKIILVYIFSVIILFFWASRILVEGKWLFRKTLLDWPLIIFLISQFISLLFSIDNRTSWMGYYSRFNGGFLSLLCYSFLYWAAVTHLDSKSTKSIIHYSLFTSALVSFYGVLEHFGIDKNLWVQDVQTRVFSTLGQPNWLAAYIAALIFIPLANITQFKTPFLPWQSQFWDKSKRIKDVTPAMEFSAWKYLWNWFSFLILFITLLFTKSRSGIAAFAICSVLFWFLMIVKNKSKYLINPILYFLLFTVALFLIIDSPFRGILFSKISLNTSPSSQSTVSNGTALESGGTESGAIRKIVWQGALDIWKSSPKNWWIGTGTETFAMAYYQHRPLAHNLTSEWELLYNKAHNEFLNYLATTGTLGLTTYIILLTFMVYVLSTRNTNVALLAGWLTIPLTNFWGFSVVIVQILMFLLPAFAHTFSIQPTTNDQRPTTKSQIWIILIFFATPALILLYFILSYWLADTHYSSGQKNLRSFALTQEPSYLYSAYQSYLTAYELNKADPPISSDLSVVSAYLAVIAQSTEPQLSKNLLNTSLAAGAKSVSASPYHPNYYKSFSRTFVILASLDPKYLISADQVLEAAQKISPTDPRIPFNRGIIAQYTKNYSAAKDYFSTSLKLKPDFADAKVAHDSVATLSATPRP